MPKIVVEEKLRRFKIYFSYKWVCEKLKVASLYVKVLSTDLAEPPEQRYVIIGLLDEEDNVVIKRALKYGDWHQFIIDNPPQKIRVCIDADIGEWKGLHTFWKPYLVYHVIPNIVALRLEEEKKVFVEVDYFKPKTDYLKWKAFLAKFYKWMNVKVCNELGDCIVMSGREFIESYKAFMNRCKTK